MWCMLLCTSQCRCLLLFAASILKVQGHGERLDEMMNIRLEGPRSTINLFVFPFLFTGEFTYLSSHCCVHLDSSSRWQKVFPSLLFLGKLSPGLRSQFFFFTWLHLFLSLFPPRTQQSAGGTEHCVCSSESFPAGQPPSEKADARSFAVR